MIFLLLCKNFDLVVPDLDSSEGWNLLTPNDSCHPIAIGSHESGNLLARVRQLRGLCKSSKILNTSRR